MLFLWLKGLHIIAVICWFAGLFYLPRLFVYHSMTQDTASRAQFKIMERKLYRGIMTPSAAAAVGVGAWIFFTFYENYRDASWIKIKIALVLLLILYHATCGYYLRLFAEDKKTPSHIFFRYFNEFPVLLLVPIIFLAVLKPF